MIGVVGEVVGDWGCGGSIGDWGYGGSSRL